MAVIPREEVTLYFSVGLLIFVFLSGFDFISNHAILYTVCYANYSRGMERKDKVYFVNFRNFLALYALRVYYGK